MDEEEKALKEEALITEFHLDQKEFKEAFGKFCEKWGDSIATILVSRIGIWDIGAMPMRQCISKRLDNNQS